MYKSLKLIEEIYDESMYGNNDIFRIKDIVHSFDDNHWRGKQWVADIVKNYYEHKAGNVLIMGGWYGMMAYQMRKAFPDRQINITSVDMDPRCEEFGYKLFGDMDINFVTQDITKLNLQAYDIIINTSVEHMDFTVIRNILKSKRKDTLIAFQSNDYFEELSHINCSRYLTDFVEDVEQYLSEERARYWGEMNMHGFKRFMVVGR